MAQHTVELVKGLTVGGRPNKTAVLRELTAGDVIDALQESERLLMVPGANGLEPRLVHSGALMGIATLRRQIASIGEINGPIEREYFNQLSNEDLDRLQSGADAMDAAIARAIQDRGRAEAAGGDGGTGN